MSTALPLPEFGKLVREEADEAGTYGWRTYQSHAGQQWDVQGAGRFSVSPDGSDVRCKKAPGAKKGDFEHVLTGTVLNQALQSLGITLLHAGAILDGPGAVAVTAQSGFGKSTLIAHLSRRGHPVLTDDTLPVVGVEGGRAMVDCHLPRMKLWEDSLHALGARPDGCEHVFSWIPKRQVPTGDYFGEQARGGPFALSSLYLLSPTVERVVPEIRGLEGVHAVLAVLGSMYMPSLLTGERGAAALDAAAKVAARISVRVIRYTRSFDTLDELGDAILEDARRLLHA